MNKKLLQSIFPDALRLIESKKCPTCTKSINEAGEFRDQLSRKEFTISGICQVCQDKIFKKHLSSVPR